MGEHARKRVLRVTRQGRGEGQISKNVSGEEESIRARGNRKALPCRDSKRVCPFAGGARTRQTYRLRHRAGVRGPGDPGTRSSARTPAPSPRTAASLQLRLRQLCNRTVSVRHSSNMFLWSYMIGQAPPARISIRRREKGRHWIQLAAFCLLPDSPAPC